MMTQGLPHRLLAAAVAALLVAAPLSAAEGCYQPVPLRPKDAELIRVSGELEDQFVRRGDVLTSGPALDLVRRVGARVAPAHPVDDYQRFRFGVIDSPVPNAFALPDGQVYVHSGLLAILENEAQLAGVLAHECMHVEGHHGILGARDARRKVGGMVALSIALGQWASLVNIALVHAIIGYTRDLEQEADLRAIDRVVEAGYDPREMPGVFALLDLDPEGESVRPKTATWSDHPLSEQRSQYTTQVLDGMAARLESLEKEGKLETGDAGFADAVLPLARRAARQYLAADRPRTALVLAQRLVEKHPDDPADQVLLGDAFRQLDARPAVPPDTEMTKRAKRAKQKERATKTASERAMQRLGAETGKAPLEQNRAHARAAYEEALRLQSVHPGALEGLARLSEAEGLLVEAGHYWSSWLESAPPGDPLTPTAVQHLKDITRELNAKQQVKP
jgi:predicted Zn-dependent protease